MRYRKIAAALTAFLCLTCGCSKNKTPDVPEEEPAGVTEAIETASAPQPEAPADKPLGSLTYEDFTEVNVNLSVLDEKAPVKIETYEFPLVEEGSDMELLYVSTPMFDGDMLYFYAEIGRRDYNVEYNDEGTVIGVTSDVIEYESCLYSFDIAANELNKLAENVDDLIMMNDGDDVFNVIPLAAHDGYIYYQYTKYQKNELNGYLAENGWLMRLDLSTLEKEMLCETGDYYIYVENGEICEYGDNDILRFDMDSNSWEMLLEDYESQYVDPAMTGECFYLDDPELGYVTYLRKEGEKERSVTTDKYSIKTKLRSGGLISVTDKMVVISNGGDWTLHVYDLEHMERYSYDLSGLGMSENYEYWGDGKAYGVLRDQPIKCGDHIIVYSVATSEDYISVNDMEAYVLGGIEHHVTASYFMPEFGVAYRLGEISSDVLRYFPEGGTIGDKVYFFTGEELILISEETPQ